MHFLQRSGLNLKVKGESEPDRRGRSWKPVFPSSLKTERSVVTEQIQKTDSRGDFAQCSALKKNAIRSLHFFGGDGFFDGRAEFS